MPSRVSLLISILRLNLVLTYWIPPDFRGGVHLFIHYIDPSNQGSRVRPVTEIDKERSTAITVKNGVNAPIEANAPGRKKSQKIAKNGANAPGGALIFIFELKNAPGRFFSRFFERKAQWSEPTTRKSVRKGTLRSMQLAE